MNITDNFLLDKYYFIFFTLQKQEVFERTHISPFPGFYLEKGKKKFSIHLDNSPEFLFYFKTSKKNSIK